MTSANGEYGARFPQAPMRYRIDALRGHGGAGTVYEAWDHDLGRRLALKFLRDDRPEQRARMLREARAQARIDHPNVCRVFDVGEEAGRPYIAMEWIAGETLDAIAPSLTLEQKVAVVRDVANGVHAAHAQQVIHRDLKPSNILVERADDGTLRAVVVDFGLARAMDEPGTTATGDIVGTPHYLAPEQAWGAPADRRSDVYSLGATLYHLLAGSPPYAGHSATDVMLQVISGPPRPLRQVASSVPKDLALIVETCMRKEPERRYDSARSLGEDLDRWLAGLPVAAEAPGLAYRAAMFFRRHRAVAAAVTLATVLTGSAAGWWIVRLQQDRVTREITAKLEDRTRYVERLIEYDRSLPLHDTRPALTRVAGEIQKLRAEREFRDFPHPLAYAEGRAKLATGDWRSARTLLERAWNGGFQTHAVGYHLGMAISAEYAEALLAAERIQQEELRRLRVTELRDRYHKAALPPLVKARGYIEQPPALIEARIALLEGDHERSVGLATAVLRQFPWNNEARLLTAEAYVRRAGAKRLSGEFAEAQALLSQAARLYDEARVIARSDVRVLDGACQAGNILLQVMADTGRDQEPTFERTRRSCEEALVADPGRLNTWIALSSAWTTIAFARGVGGGKTNPSRDRAIEAADRALAIAPHDGGALVQAARAWYWTSSVNSPRVVALMRRAVAAEPSSLEARHGLGRALLRLNDHLWATRRERRPVLFEAITHYEEVLRRAPDYIPAATNYCFALNHLAEDAFGRGEDPRPYYERMLKLVEPRMARKKEVALLPYLAAVAWFGIAQYQYLSDDDPTLALRRCHEFLDQAIRLNPNHVLSYNMRARTHVLEAVATSDAASRSRSFLAAGEELRRIETVDIASIGSAELHSMRATYMDEPKAALAAIRMAEQSAETVVEKAPDFRDTQAAWMIRARIEAARCRAVPAQCRRDLLEDALRRAEPMHPLLRRDFLRQAGLTGAEG